MSTIYKKIEFKCDLGCNYGSCDKTNAFFLKNQISTDTFSVYFQAHKEDESSIIEHVIDLTDNSSDALANLLYHGDKDFENITAEELEQIKNL